MGLMPSYRPDGVTLASGLSTTKATPRMMPTSCVDGLELSRMLRPGNDGLETSQGGLYEN